MSFILDALKKAERERSRVPTLASVHGQARKTPHAIHLWVAAGALLAGGGLLIWLLWPSPSVAPPAADSLARVNTPPPSSRAIPEREISSAERVGSPPPSSPVRVPQTPDVGQEPEAPRQPGQASVATPRPFHAPPANLPVPAGVQGGAGTATNTERRRVEIKPIAPRRAEPAPIESSPATPRPTEPPTPPQMEASPRADRPQADVAVPSSPPVPAGPSMLHEAMAKMTLDVFVYTGVKADRMVVINGRRYVQGQYVDGRFLLEDITPEGPVLSYQGERALLRP